MHTFPKDERLKKAWIRKVGQTRADFSFKSTKRLCGAHFLDDDFVRNRSLAIRMGIKVSSFRLKCGSIPSVFKKKCSSPKKHKESFAQHKRNLLQVDF